MTASTRNCPHTIFAPGPLPRLRGYETQSALGKRPTGTACDNDSADEGDVESEIEARKKKLMRYYESDSGASLVESEQDSEGPATPRNASPGVSTTIVLHYATCTDGCTTSTPRPDCDDFASE